MTLTGWRLYLQVILIGSIGFVAVALLILGYLSTKNPNRSVSDVLPWRKTFQPKRAQRKKQHRR